jgi:hypothetical protein
LIAFIFCNSDFPINPAGEGVMAGFGLQGGNYPQMTWPIKRFLVLTFEQHARRLFVSRRRSEEISN